MQQLHSNAQYVYHFGPHRGSTTTTNGIKRGCVIAPYLRNYFSLTFLLLLQQQRSIEWIQRVLDDVWGSWEITSAADLQALWGMCRLCWKPYKLLRGPSTTARRSFCLIIKLAGKDASKLKREHTFMKAGQLCRRLKVAWQRLWSFFKDQHEYLGTVVTYRRRHQRNMQHRLRTCTARVPWAFRSY